jgi:hypothetical protein
VPAEDTLIIRMRTEGGVTAEVEIAGVSRSMEGVEKQAGKTSKAVGGFGKGMQGMRGLAQGLAFGGLAVGIGEVAKKTMELQQNQAALSNSLKASHQPVSQTLGVMTEASDKLSQSGGFATAQDLQALNAFTTAGEKAGTAIKDLNLATDIARGRHLQLAQATRLVAQVEAGHTTGLTRLGITIPKVTAAEDKLKESHTKATVAQTAAAKAADVQATKMNTLRVLQDRFAGSTQAYAKTTAGSWSDLKNEFEVMETNLGEKFLPIVDKVIKFLAQNKTLVQDVVIAVAALTAAYAAYEVVVKAVAIAHDIQAAAAWGAEKAEAALDVAMDANPIFLVIAAVVALVAIFVVAYMKVKWFRDFVNSAWSMIKDVFKAMVDFIGDHWRILIVLMFGLIGLLVDFVTKHWNTIEAVAKWMFNAIYASAKWMVGAVTTVWNTLVKILTAPFQAVWSFVQKAANAIVSIIKWLVGQITPILGKILGPIGKVIGAGGKLLGKGEGVAKSVGNFLGLQSGGMVTGSGMFTVGEAGREDVYLPTGTAVTPSSGGGDTVIHNYLVVDGQILAQAVSRASARQLAVR